MQLVHVLLGVLVITVSSQLCFGAKTECQEKRDKYQAQVDSAKEGSLQAVLIPKCNEDGSYAPLQCHYKSNFCQCWDKEGSPMTSPKTSLRSCSCMLERAQKLKSVRPSDTNVPELTNCQDDGSFKPQQCSSEGCWCVNPETGKKLTEVNKDKTKVNC